MYAIAEFALLLPIIEYALHYGRIIEDLKFVQVIADVFIVIFLFTIFKEGFILGLKYGFLIVTWVASVRHVNSS